MSAQLELELIPLACQPAQAHREALKRCWLVVWDRAAFVRAATRARGMLAARAISEATLHPMSRIFPALRLRRAPVADGWWVASTWYSRPGEGWAIEPDAPATEIGPAVTPTKGSVVLR